MAASKDDVKKADKGEQLYDTISHKIQLENRKTLLTPNTQTPLPRKTQTPFSNINIVRAPSPS
jgi:hypothetical protein